VTEESTVAITGGARGLGFEAARQIATARPGWRIVLGVRDLAAGSAAAQRINASCGAEAAQPIELDLSSLDSVRGFCAQLQSLDRPPLRVVIANAGIQVIGREGLTRDGYEETFGVNHLAHFLLVHLLVGHIERPARVIFVTSDTHDPARRTGMPAPRWQDPEALAHDRDGGTDTTAGRRRYTTSKLANVMTVYELDRRLTANGTPDVSVLAFNPGLMPGTGLARDYGPLARFAWRYVMPVLTVVRPKSVRTTRRSGADLAWLATHPSLQKRSGRYFDGREETRSSEESYDREKAALLWEASARMTGLPAAGEPAATHR
jgi:NAD(P)-dependent dehydrogenase (short-subunit alcohol dehydrogenase family)